MKMWIERCKAVMTRRLLVAVIAVVAVGSVATFNSAKSAIAAAPPPAAAPLDDNSVGALLTLDRAMETLAARVTPAVVNVTVASRTHVQQSGAEGMPDMQQFFGPGAGPDGGPGPGNPFGRQFGREFNFPSPQNRMEHGLGSGVIISPDGYIVTNNHVIDGAVDIRVTMSNREVLPAKLVGADPLTDLAVIKVNATNLPSVPWGNSASLRPGQTVLAFGNPYGFRFTVTRGIISALNRPNPDASDRRKPGEFIQTDVAIPAQIVKPTVETLIRDGKVTHAFIGIQISDVTPDNAKFFQMNKAEGALISEVEPDAPGAKAGLRTGDVITELDGKPVTNAGQLQMIVGQKRPGETIHLQIVRDSKPMSVVVKLEALGGDKGTEIAGSEHGKGRWGLSLADLTPDVRNELQAQASVHGAIVEDVQPGSPADNAGLQRGDVIMEVNRHSVKSASEVAQALSGVPSGQDALVLVWSNGGSTFRVLHPSQG